MCGRIVQSGGPELPGLKIHVGTPDDSRVRTPRYNGAPSQELVVIRRHPNTGDNSADLLQWGLVPYWVKEEKPRSRPINATVERLSSAPMFRSAYAKRRCIVPVNAFFEWKATKARGPRQPYAFGMKDGSHFGLAGLWENWKHPGTGEWLRSFCIITCPANDLISTIHDRMPVILHSADYDRWLACIEPDPRDLLVPCRSDMLQMWPVTTRVNSPKDDDPGLLEPISDVADPLAQT